MSGYQQPGYGPQQPYGTGPGWQSGAAPGGYGYPQGPGPGAPGYAPGPGYGTQPPPPSTSAAMWAHLGALLTITAGSAMCCGLGAFLGWIAPVSVRNGERHRHDPYVRHHATQALNFGITQAVMAVLGTALYFLTMIIFSVAADEAQRESAGMAIPMLTVVVIMGLYGISGIVCAIIATVKATRGEWWTYPRLIAWPLSKG